ncbi:MAG: flagellar hook capping FlgD N-terminal domain-containing protein [Dehalococcoidia bacterium]
MAAVENIGKGLGDLVPPAGAGQVKSRDLGEQDFMKLMIEQMRSQNPLEPQDNNQFFSQMVQFESLDAMHAISAALKSLAEVSEIANASTLVGHTVLATRELEPDPVTKLPRPPEQISGVVSKVTFGASGAMVHIGDRQVPASAITEVS